MARARSRAYGLTVREELVALASRLVAIDSVNPDLVPGGAGEGEIARFIAGWLSERGLDVESTEVAPGRWNVVARARGSGGGRTLLLNGHMDTVGVAGMDAPFDPRVENDRLYGRGAYDMKSSLAAIMLAGARAQELDLRGDVVVTTVADEEVASIGATAVAASVEADAAIVAEPTELDLAVAHRGFGWLEVETVGRAAHGSRAELGIDAIVTAAAERDEAVRADVRVTFWRDPFAVDQDAEIVGAVRRAAAATGGEPELVGRPFWTDAAVFADAGIPTVLFGPVGTGAHATEEWVDLASVERCVEVYLGVAAELCA
jgi:acetylornithine deacetylase/succinyl-diaminopimelate desuccinylase-like protein